MFETGTNRDNSKSCCPKFQLFLASVSRGSSNLTPRINVAAIDDLEDKTGASTRRIVADKEFPKKVSADPFDYLKIAQHSQVLSLPYPMNSSHDRGTVPRCPGTVSFKIQRLGS